MTFISRRELLKRAGAAGVAAAASGGIAGALDGQSGLAASAAQTGVREATALAPLEHLTAAEAELLDAIVARLIPGSAADPGAREAGAVRYIDRALGGALAASRPAYASGLAALDRYARASRGAPFPQLSPAEQDAVLLEVEGGTANEFPERSSVFFALVLSHTLQGTFGDPYYGGNANFVGWDLIGYPGVRTIVSPSDQQRLERRDLRPNHRSAYDEASFTKAAAHAGSEHDTHGD